MPGLRHAAALPPGGGAPAGVHRALQSLRRAAALPGGAALALVLVALACGLTALLAHITDRLLPIVFFTLLLVIAAYFLWPLTLHSGVPKRKK